MGEDITGDIKEMNLRYAGACVNCGTIIPKGERAIYDRGTKTVYHIACPPSRGSQQDPALVLIPSEDKQPEQHTLPKPLTPPQQWTDLALNKPGQAVRQQALAEKQATKGFAHVLNRIFDVKTEERAWRIGADGEEIVATELNKLARKDERWHFLHSIPVGSRASDIDHLAIGPTGVYSINAKHHPNARINVYRNTIYINGSKNTTYIRNSKFEANRASKILTNLCGFPVQVYGLIVPVNASSFIIKQQPEEVTVINRAKVANWLFNQVEMHTLAEIKTIYEIARRSNTWKSKP